MSRSSSFLLLAFVCFSFLPWGDCHAILISPTARTGQAIAPGLKIATLPVPANIGCGGSAAGDPGAKAVVATYHAGDSITVTWQITIPHDSAPGVSVALQYSSTDTFTNNLLVSGVDVNALSTTVTLPAGKTSSTAVLQWIWASSSDGGFYVGCSDIAILAAAPAATTTAPAAGTTTTTTKAAGAGAGATTTAAGAGTTPKSSDAFAIRYSVGVLAMLVAALVAAFLYE